MARARKTNTLYLMHAPLCRNEINMATDTVGELWHKRLRHMSEKWMRKLAADDIIPEVKNVHLVWRASKIEPLSDRDHR